VAEPFENLPEAVTPSDANPYQSPLADEVAEAGSTTSGEITGAESRPWSWVPSLYFAEAVPYVLVMTVSVVFYNRMGLSNTEVAAYTSLLYLPWVIKPLWSPLVDVLGTKRRWIIVTQFLIGAGVLGIAASVNSSQFLLLTLGCFTLLALASATHDIAADGFYLIGMDTHRQAWFVGIRSSFYRLGIIATGGLLVAVAGELIERSWSVSGAWSTTFAVAGATFLVLAIYHGWSLPHCEVKRGATTFSMVLEEGSNAFATFFLKPHIAIGIAYILLYRFAEGQLTKLVQPFLLDPRVEGGLGLSVKASGLLYGTVGASLLVLGGILGGLAVARHGLRTWFLWMALAINLPNLAYVALAFWQPEQMWLIALAVAVEQFGYGFGFAGYMLYMLSLCKGAHETAHYAFCTGIMALGMMLPGFVSGYIEDQVGYFWFFVWVMVSTIPSFVVATLVPVDPKFGLEARATGEPTA
jgi:MFS transporter, PAT family, beta-lactamase induction signal transducer AmpG